MINDVVECVEKRFSDYLIAKLRKRYREVLRKIIHIFKEKKIDIDELMTILCFEMLNLFSLLMMYLVK